MEQADYIARTSLNASDRFLKATQEAFRKIATMPGIGSPRDFNNPALQGLRVFFVPRFSKIGIYSLTTETTTEIVRVLHGARDIASIFAPKSEEETQADE